MFSFLKKKSEKSSYMDKSQASHSLSERFLEFFESLHDKPDEEIKLEIKIINSDGKTQEIEITYGNKKRRKKIAKLLPDELSFDPITLAQTPAITVQALNLNSLSNPQKDFFIFKKRLLEAMSKINAIFINKNNLMTDDQKYSTLWNSTAKKFEITSDEISDKANLTTMQKALLLAITNNNLDEKLNRTIISQKYDEIEDKIAFKKFIFAAINVLKNKDLLIAQLFPSNNFSDEMKINLKSQIDSIINEKDPSTRESKIKSLRTFVDQTTNIERFRQ